MVAIVLLMYSEYYIIALLQYMAVLGFLEHCLLVAVEIYTRCSLDSCLLSQVWSLDLSTFANIIKHGIFNTKRREKQSNLRVSVLFWLVFSIWVSTCVCGTREIWHFWWFTLTAHTYRESRQNGVLHYFWQKLE